MCNVKTWSELISIRVGTRGGAFECGNEVLGSID